jgi:hypothetical protein
MKNKRRVSFQEHHRASPSGHPCQPAGAPPPPHPRRRSVRQRSNDRPPPPPGGASRPAIGDEVGQPRRRPTRLPLRPPLHGCPPEDRPLECEPPPASHGWPARASRSLPRPGWRVTAIGHQSSSRLRPPRARPDPRMRRWGSPMRSSSVPDPDPTLKLRNFSPASTTRPSSTDRQRSN